MWSQDCQNLRPIETSGARSTKSNRTINNALITSIQRQRHASTESAPEAGEDHDLTNLGACEVATEQSIVSGMYGAVKPGNSMPLLRLLYAKWMTASLRPWILPVRLQVQFFSGSQN